MTTSNVLKAGILLSGLLALFSAIALAENPTVEGRRRRRKLVGIRVLDTPEDVSRSRLEYGWHWFARQYPDGRFSPPWWTTRDAAKRGLSSIRATLWGYDDTDRRWVTDSWRAGRVI